MVRVAAGPWTQVRGGSTIEAYTRDVVSWARRLTSLATMLALSGTPALLPVCMVLCLGGAPVTAMDGDDGASMGHAAHGAAPSSNAASGQLHHDRTPERHEPAESGAS
jgi:hypothetical protein